MRTSWWACIFVGVLTCLVAYQHFNQPPLPTGSLGTSGQSERHPPNQKPEQPLTTKDEARLPDVDSASAGLEPDRLPNARKEARLEDVTGAGPAENSELNE